MPTLTIKMPVLPLLAISDAPADLDAATVTVTVTNANGMATVIEGTVVETRPHETDTDVVLATIDYDYEGCGLSSPTAQTDEDPR